MPKLLIDENFDQRILRGLQLRVSSLQYMVVQETVLAESPDSVLLHWAAENNYVLVTHDRATMLRAASRRLRSVQKIAGLVIVKKEASLSRVIDDLVVVLECCTCCSFPFELLTLPFPSPADKLPAL